MNKQQQSEAYWVNAHDTHLAPAEFYQHKKNVLTNILEKLPPITHALDIGCGNGEFTSLLFSKAATIKGIDISPKLISIANSKYGINDRVSFTCSSIDIIAEPEHYFDMIFCMGLTSCIISDDKFHSLITNIKRLSAPPSYIVMGDSLSKGDDILLDHHDGYVAKYRDENSYLSKIESLDIKLVEERTISVNASETIINKLFLFRS
ncbi:TPA: class I SAM-dependent methyltransferase [Aeromonas veronii]|nr:class I SAM-dependent methyltransferase [Aeromonas veronii]